MKLGQLDGRLGAVGQAQVNFSASSGAIVQAHIVLDEDERWVVYPGEACFNQTAPCHDCPALDLESIATHEIGHTLGFDHVWSGLPFTLENHLADPDRAATMYPFIVAGESHKRSLETGEKLGMVGIYGPGS